MAKFLVYTSPAKGHLYPLVPTLLELTRRGHQVAIRTLASEVEKMRGLGFSCEAMAPVIERREIDDWKASSPPAALLAACRTFAERGKYELPDLHRALEVENPDVLYVDVNCWGAAAGAESSRLPWAVFAPYFLPVQVPGAPPWGLGLSPMSGVLGRARDALLWSVVHRLYDRALPELNSLRALVRAPTLRHVAEAVMRAPRVISYTAEPFEYPRAWPENVRQVGPGLWEPGGGDSSGQEGAFAQAKDERPLVLVTCSTEFQNDGKLVETALAALADEPVRVVATTASVDPALFRPPANARVERFLPHGPLLREAACVVCHGGMGITQKALAAGVPLCVVPFGRDQLEVARHVEVAGAGTRLLPKRLTPERLKKAVREAMARASGAQRVAEGFRNAGGAAAAASALESLLPASGRLRVQG